MVLFKVTIFGFSYIFLSCNHLRNLYAESISLKGFLQNSEIVSNNIIILESVQ